jgi:DNA-directed RNA polymerase subunit RPC12/RpoP
MCNWNYRSDSHHIIYIYICINCKNLHGINNIQIKALLTCQCHVNRGCKINVSVPNNTWIE